MRDGLITDSEGNRRWYRDGHLLHRTDGPAVMYVNGDCDWWINGNWAGLEISTWLVENNYIWPFDESTLVAFKLRFL